MVFSVLSSFAGLNFTRHEAPNSIYRVGAKALENNMACMNFSFSSADIKGAQISFNLCSIKYRAHVVAAWNH